jgi:hypothetical protein
MIDLEPELHRRIEEVAGERQLAVRDDGVTKRGGSPGA